MANVWNVKNIYLNMQLLLLNNWENQTSVENLKSNIKKQIKLGGYEGKRSCWTKKDPYA